MTAPRAKRASLVVMVHVDYRRVHRLVAVLTMIGARRAFTFGRRWKVAATFSIPSPRDIARFLRMSVLPAIRRPPSLLFVSIRICRTPCSLYCFDALRVCRSPCSIQCFAALPVCHIPCSTPRFILPLCFFRPHENVRLRSCVPWSTRKPPGFGLPLTSI